MGPVVILDMKIDNILEWVTSFFDLDRPLKMLGKKKRGRPSPRLVGAWVASACLTSRRKQGGTP